jgi:hypothetical protein
MSSADREAKHLAPHESLAEPMRIRGHRREGDVALPAQQEIGDICTIDLARADLELRVAVAQQLEE